MTDLWLISLDTQDYNRSFQAVDTSLRQLRPMWWRSAQSSLAEATAKEPALDFPRIKEQQLLISWSPKSPGSSKIPTAGFFLAIFFWLLQQFQQLRCNIRSLSRTLHFPSFLVVMCSPLPVSKMQMFRALQANLLCSASKRHGWQAHFTSWNPAFRRASLHNSPGNITRARRHLGMRPWNLAVPVVYRYIYLQTAWLQVKTWKPWWCPKWCHMCWPLLTRRASKRLLRTLSLVDTSALRERRNFYDFRNLNQDKDEDEEWKDSVSSISIW